MSKRAKKSHEDYRQSSCIACLSRPKGLRPLVNQKTGDTSMKCHVEKCLKINSEDFNFLPNVICSNCRNKIMKCNDPSEYEICVKYDELIENVKNLTTKKEHDECFCEICVLGSTLGMGGKGRKTQNESQYLIFNQISVGRPAIKRKLPKITDYYGESKESTKVQKIENIIETTDKDSLEQLLAIYLEKKEKETDQDYVLLKRPHGPPRKVPKLGANKDSKTVLSHSTLYKIKTAIKGSGRKIVLIKEILNEDPNIKCEEYFKESVVEKNHELDDFFDHKLLDLEIYDQQDFQLWQKNDEGHLVDKVKITDYKLWSTL